MKCTCLKLTGSCTCNNCQKTSSDNVSYIGPNLPCSGIDANDSITVAIQKLDDKICPITTTTTTTASLFSYHSYVALISHVQLNPTTTTFERNGLGGTVDILTTDIGTYTLTFVDPVYPFSPENVWPIISGVDLGFTAFIMSSADNQVTINTYDFDGVLADNILFNTAIEIRVYPQVFFIQFSSAGYDSSALACSNPSVVLNLYSRNVIGVGVKLYEDKELTVPFDGESLWYQRFGTAWQVDSNGIVMATATC